MNDIVRKLAKIVRIDEIKPIDKTKPSIPPKNPKPKYINPNLLWLHPIIQ